MLPHLAAAKPGIEKFGSEYQFACFGQEQI